MWKQKREKERAKRLNRAGDIGSGAKEWVGKMMVERRSPGREK